ncbi:DUF4336 domain-containing protein [Maliponia aquimaris]|uniref:DUF4336 domain-containing protein n=1 Tax=Maliponia aquimaris TaxID=1673631 RepID=UPI001FE51F2C|nr:DUF4336 domain-containing protein [Maliponia aquimaris]
MGKDLWTVEGPTVEGAAGFRFPTRMCIARLPDGSLWLHSPIALTPEVHSAVSNLGPVRHLIAPNDLHYMSLPAWCAAHPRAQVHTAPGVTKKCLLTGTETPLGDTPPASWEGVFDQVMFRGNLITTEVVFFHRSSGTAIFTDLLQQMPAGWFSGWRSVVARLDRMTGDAPAVPWKFRLAFRDRVALRAALARVRDWPVQRLAIAHGPVVSTNAGTAVRHAFAWSA